MADEPDERQIFSASSHARSIARRANPPRNPKKPPRPCRPPRPPARPLHGGRPFGARRLRTSRTAAVPLHSPPRHQAARQGADRPLRLLRRGARRRSETADGSPGVKEAVAADLKTVAAAAQRMLKGEIAGARGAVVMERRARLLQRHDGARDARTVPYPVSRQEERADRRRGAADRHGRPHAGLSARGDAPRAGTLGYRHHPGAQPPVWRSRRPRAPTST
jgi:hypothetical protein